MSWEHNEQNRHFIVSQDYILEFSKQKSIFTVFFAGYEI